jgi:hypothetical protein
VSFVVVSATKSPNVKVVGNLIANAALKNGVRIRSAHNVTNKRASLFKIYSLKTFKMKHK